MCTFTKDELVFMSLYNAAGTRDGLLLELLELRDYLGPDDEYLRDLTESTICKLRTISDEAFTALELDSLGPFAEAEK